MYSGTSPPPEPSLGSSASSAVVVRLRTKTVNKTIGEVQAVSKRAMPESVTMPESSSTLQELCGNLDRDKITAFLDSQVNYTVKY